MTTVPEPNSTPSRSRRRRRCLRPGAGRLRRHAAGAVLDRHPAARARAGRAGRRAGQARAISRDLLRGAAGARRRGPRPPPLRRSADAARHGARRHRPAGAARRVEPPSGRRGGARASATTASRNGCRPPGTVDEHVRKYGYELRPIKVDALSSSDQQRAPDPRRGDGDGPGPGSAAPRAGRLLEGRARCPRGDRQLSGDPPAGGRRGEHRRRGGRLAAGQRRRAVPGRSAAPLSGRDLRLRRRRRSGQPAPRRAQGLAGAEPAAERRADLLGRDLAAAGAHLVDPARQRQQAEHDRRAQRQPGDLLRPGHSGLDAWSATSMPTTGRSPCRSRARTTRSARCSSPRTPIRARRCSKRCCASSKRISPRAASSPRTR